MKKIFLFLTVIFFSGNIFAASFNKMIFFGDSLTDNGNLYSLMLNLLPKSPPYYKGRFSNGPTWAEGVGNHFYNKYFIDYKVYALGGATALVHLPTDKYISPSSLNMEVDKYLLDYAFRDKSNVLFSIWIGGNDYLHYHDTDGDQLTTDVVNKISTAIVKLINQGGTMFLLVNLPDLSRTPWSKEMNISDRVGFLAKLHNKKLATALDGLRKDYPQVKIHLVDAFSYFEDLMADPTKYNKKYNVNITDTTTACWQGKYYYLNQINETNLRDELKQTLLKQNKLDLNTDEMGQFILNSPVLLNSYMLAKYTDSLCQNANEHVFWDTIHPSAIVHEVFAKVVVEQLAAIGITPSHRVA